MRTLGDLANTGTIGFWQSGRHRQSREATDVSVRHIVPGSVFQGSVLFGAAEEACAKGQSLDLLPVKVDVPCGFMHRMYHAHFRESKLFADHSSPRPSRPKVPGNGLGRRRATARNVIDLTEEDAVWPGFDGPDDMDFWKAIAVSMGQGTSIRTVY